MTSRRLAIADALAIVGFATVGQLPHHGSVSAGGYAHDALPLLGCWFAAAAVLGLYAEGRPGLSRFALLGLNTESRSAPRRFVLTWLIGVTGGVLIRAAILGRQLGGKELGFLITSLVFVLLFVLGARAIAYFTVRRRGRVLAGGGGNR
ncbi:MAG TPA: DUF3054 domain-containing protein [Thermoleophilaceae bacterium]|nr:DUF3054 domain-containing protein [Thermoleophilaceae bacterium]